MTKTLATLATFASLALAARAAAADPSPAAEQLFRDGKQLMKAGQVAEACDAFEASEQTEHDVATLMNLADCRDKNGQLASAWALFLRVDAEARTDSALGSLADTARSRAAMLEDRLSFLVVNVPEENHVQGLLVIRDGAPLDVGAWNRAIPIDGGTHVVGVKAPGHEPWQTTVIVAAERAHEAVEVPKFSELQQLTPEPAAAPPASPPPVVPIVLHPVAGVAGAPARSRAPFWTAALVVVGGVAILAGGSALLAAHEESLSATALCPSSGCDSAGAGFANQQQADADSWAHGGDILVGVGVASLLGAVIVWEAHTSAPRTALRITPQLGDAPGFALSGSF